MAKNLVSTIISDIKVLGDYNITDTSLDSLLLKAVNYAVRRIRNFMVNYRLYEDITERASFKTIADQEYVDVTNAVIVGDSTTFTGVAGDTIDLNVDGTDYLDIAINASTDIADVVTAINTAVGSVVASEDDNGYLMITSPTSGSGSEVTIADGTSTVATCIARLFSVAVERTQSAITDLDSIMFVADVYNDSPLCVIGYDEHRTLYPDPDAFSGQTPMSVAVFKNYLYFGPKPSASTFLYMDYIKRLTALTSTATMPFDEMYDELVISMALEWLHSFLDAKDRATILTAKERTLELLKQLIVNSPKSKWVDNQADSRGHGTITGPMKALRMTE